MQVGVFILLLAASLSAATLDQAGLKSALAGLAAKTPGRVGVCVQTEKASVCIHAEDKFAMQSVMKLMVAFAVMDAVDTNGWRLEEPVTLYTKDLSLFVQPISKLVGPNGYRTTIGDLVRRAVIDSDSAATDFLITRLKGTDAVNASLDRHGVTGIRVDRDERHLQTEISGIVWRPEFVDASKLDHAIAAVPSAQRDKAFAAYQRDPRDTATPSGMAAFLFRLAHGELLSRSSTDFLLAAMKDCATFPDRLKAGTPSAWQIMHKTGTSGTWKGVTAATNDVGILKAPDGTLIVISALIADSPASSAKRASAMAGIARIVVAHFR